jgi:hypothetical protein
MTSLNSLTLASPVLSTDQLRAYFSRDASLTDDLHAQTLMNTSVFEWIQRMKPAHHMVLCRMTQMENEKRIAIPPKSWFHYNVGFFKVTPPRDRHHVGIALSLLANHSPLIQTDVVPVVGKSVATNEYGALHNPFPIANNAYSCMLLPPSRIIPSTLVWCVSSILTKWQIDLVGLGVSFRTIQNSADVRLLRSEISANKYFCPVTLVRCGRLTMTEKTSKEEDEVVEFVREASLGRIWRRVIVDGCDLIKNIRVPCLRAGFTWLWYSSDRVTKACCPPAPPLGNGSCSYATAQIVRPPMGYSEYFCGQHLFRPALTITCDASVWKISAKPRVHVTLFTFTDNSETSPGMTAAACEMVANNRFLEAAHACKNVIETISDLTTKLLGKRVTRFYQLLNLTDGVDWLLANISSASCNLDVSLVTILQDLCIDPRSQKARIEFSKSTCLAPILRQHIPTVRVMTEKCGLELYRLRVNYLDAMCGKFHCQCCLCDFGEQICFVMRCCHILICTTCMFERRRARREILTHCPNCSQTIHFRNGVVCVPNATIFHPLNNDLRGCLAVKLADPYSFNNLTNSIICLLRNEPVTHCKHRTNFELTDCRHALVSKWLLVGFNDCQFEIATHCPFQTFVLPQRFTTKSQNIAHEFCAAKTPAIMFAKTVACLTDYAWGEVTHFVTRGYFATLALELKTLETFAATNDGTRSYDLKLISFVSENESIPARLRKLLEKNDGTG